MIEWDNDCVSCERCVNCGRGKYPIFICDRCENDVEELWEYEGEQLCEECLKKAVPKVEVKE